MAGEDSLFPTQQQGEEVVTSRVSDEGVLKSTMDDNVNDWEVQKTLGGAMNKQKYHLVVAFRKSTRGAPASITTHSGMTSKPSNAILVLDTCEDNVLENIASDCDIKFGKSREEAKTILTAMRAEEIARAALAEAAHNKKREERLMNNHVLEGENLALEVTTNSKRGLLMIQWGRSLPRQRIGGSKLERELKRISIK